MFDNEVRLGNEQWDMRRLINYCSEVPPINKWLGLHAYELSEIPRISVLVEKVIKERIGESHRNRFFSFDPETDERAGLHLRLSTVTNSSSDLIEKIHQSVAYYRQELKHNNKNVKLKHSLAFSLYSLSCNFNDIGNLTEAINAAEDALKILIDLRNKNQIENFRLLTAVLIYLSSYHKELSSFQLSEIYLHEAKRTFIEHFDVSSPSNIDIATTINKNLASLYLKTNEAKALEYIEEATRCLETACQTDKYIYYEDLANCLSKRALILSQIGKHSRSIQDSKEAINIYQQLSCDDSKYHYEIALEYLTLSYSYYKFGNQKLSMNSFKMSCEQTRLLKEKRDEYTVYRFYKILQSHPPPVAMSASNEESLELWEALLTNLKSNPLFHALKTPKIFLDAILHICKIYDVLNRLDCINNTLLENKGLIDDICSIKGTVISTLDEGNLLGLASYVDNHLPKKIAIALSELAKELSKMKLIEKKYYALISRAAIL